MLFVLLSHFGFTFFPNQADRLPTVMRIIGMVASPSFVLINGILIGFLCRIRSRDDYDRLRTIFIDRGLFLLTAGHLLLLGSHAPAYTLRFFSITDTIALCLLVSPFLATRLSVQNRIALGAVSYFASAVAIDVWHPHSELSAILKESFVGTLNPIVYYYAFPFLPWFSVNCFGSALGEALGEYQLRGDCGGMKRLLAVAGGAAMTASLALNGSYLWLKHEGMPASLRNVFRELVSPLQKTPPGPGYLLWYGALGLGIILVCLALESRSSFTRPLRRAAQIGEASLFVFILQFYVYLVLILPFNTRLPMPRFWPVYLVASCAVVIAAAFEWQKRGCNRFLTVGYRGLRERADAERALTGSPEFDAGRP